MFYCADSDNLITLGRDVVGSRGTILLAHIDSFKGTQVILKKELMDAEEAAQAPSFT